MGFAWFVINEGFEVMSSNLWDDDEEEVNEGCDLLSS